MSGARVVVILDWRELENRFADARRREDALEARGEAVDREALLDWAVGLALEGCVVVEVADV